MAETDDIFGTSNVGAIAGVESSLSPYAGPYVTEMLGKGEAPPKEFSRPEVAKILIDYYQSL